MGLKTEDVHLYVEQAVLSSFQMRNTLLLTESVLLTDQSWFRYDFKSDVWNDITPLMRISEELGNSSYSLLCKKTGVSTFFRYGNKIIQERNQNCFKSSDPMICSTL